MREDSLDVKYKQVPEGSEGRSWPCYCLAGVSSRQKEEQVQRPEVEVWAGAAWSQISKGKGLEGVGRGGGW